MRLGVVNVGSSSLKLRVLGRDDAVIAEHEVEHWDGEDSPLASFVAQVGRLDAVGHRVVHGGTTFTHPVVVDDDVAAALRDLTALAPLHQPRAVAALTLARALVPGVPHVACFDTAFHSSMPAAAATYALPREWRARWPIRRFGFHGLSHAYAVRRAAAIVHRPVDTLRIVSCHLGAGASLCAVHNGRSIDTTMGFTPLEGLVMATRAGSVDPGLVVWLQQHGGLRIDEIADGLEHRSGLAGLCGLADMRDVLAARHHDPDAALAFEVYTHRLRRELGAMVGALGRLDLVAFTGGIGEHAPEVRAAAGLPIDPHTNDHVAGDAEISADGADVRTVVLTAREDVEIARQVRAVLT